MNFDIKNKKRIIYINTPIIIAFKYVKKIDKRDSEPGREPNCEFSSNMRRN